jgi:hypothetical protein
MILMAYPTIALHSELKMNSAKDCHRPSGRMFGIELVMIEDLHCQQSFKAT